MADPEGENGNEKAPEEIPGDRELRLPPSDPDGPERLSYRPDPSSLPLAPPPQSGAESAFKEVNGQDGVPSDALPSWERMEEAGFLASLFLTIKEVLFEPGKTFSRMPYSDNLKRPLVFALLIGTLGTIASVCYSAIGQALRPDLFEPVLERLRALGYAAGPLSPAEQLRNSCVEIALAPLVIIALVLVWSGIVHVMLLMFGGANRGYETTFRTVAYVYGATATLWIVVPFLGRAGLAPIWAITATIVGLAQSHRTTPAKTALAVLVPVACCCVALLAFVLSQLGLLGGPIGSTPLE